MKTESEFSEYFIEQCHCEPSDHAQVQLISQQYWTDLTSHLTTYFSYEDRLRITALAAHQLAELMRQKKSDAWPTVIRDFVQNDYWDAVPITRKPAAKKTEEQKIFWKLFKYGWAFFQSMIVLKIAVYYFGLESASRPDDISVGWVWLFFSLSVGSLGYFAYRNRHDQG